ncbi:hypothetical protein GCM10011351_12700 [Paraliobacillus quinghaiensis]|uniref:Uncharacterized protein n=1 Tax=Paraliobacillus quinghaiensis TaxID=470815 RepID=A0A917TLZ8_9BACI|nr:hypothetical protein [Paraliobacillus quinghaiensis]GGM28248.1 hypothetical protein GCM10011351_12700 [Paraliobacillus quinghaiensis]
MKINKQKSINNIVPFSMSDHSNVSSLPNLVVKSSESKRRIEELQKFVDEVMIKGVDYGSVNGFSKPTLLKPGAEKLCDVFGFSKSIEIVNRIEKWDVGIFAYEVKMTLTRKDNGVMEAEGLGSCNSKESSFQNQDAYTIVNTVLKMAKKRSLIDAVLSATRSSGIFTQDIEDFPRKQNSKRSEDQVTKAQLYKIFNIIGEMNMPTEVAKEMMKMTFGVERSKHLSKRQASDFIQDLLLLKEVQMEDDDEYNY